MSPLKYEKRGVSATKDEVHHAIRHLDKGLFPNAFCKILPDIAAGHPDWCNLMHADTAGTKTSLAYIYWRHTGDLSVWRDIAQDAIVMNLDDMACAGCIDNILLSSTIGRNKNLIPGEVISAIIEGTTGFLEILRKHGINVHLAGGETADVGDIVRTIDVGYTAFGRMPRRDVLDIDIHSGDVVVGLASYGQASYETSYNGGMGSNGLTSARHDVFHHSYASMYPDSFDSHTPALIVYSGSRKLTDTLRIGEADITLGKLVLSPTRTYLPVLKAIFETVGREYLHGLIHCTGGGQGKVLKFLKNKRVVKNNLLPVPPLFELIQAESGTDWSEMYRVFNMGHRLEIYLPEKIAPQVFAVAKSYRIDAQVIGHVEEANGESILVESPYGKFTLT